MEKYGLQEEGEVARASREDRREVVGGRRGLNLKLGYVWSSNLKWVIVPHQELRGEGESKPG